MRCRLGQVVIEMLLILPVFLTIVFTIMEMGYMAFQMILLNHATYEAARIGAMTRYKTSSILHTCDDLKPMMQRVIKSADVTCRTEQTLRDNQAGNDNFDLIVTGRNSIKLVFPISSVLMSSKLACPQGPGGGRCTIAATVRMPIEQPLKY